LAANSEITVDMSSEEGFNAFSDASECEILERWQRTTPHLARKHDVTLALGRVACPQLLDESI
jgi:hypothetical protein